MAEFLHQPFIIYIWALQTQILISHQQPVHIPLAYVLSELFGMLLKERRLFVILARKKKSFEGDFASGKVIEHYTLRNVFFKPHAHRLYCCSPLPLVDNIKRDCLFIFPFDLQS